ncbi:MAG: glycosyltransferase family 2 protein [Spirochaetota bacterium]|nr:glycosyltransferase family 2 protein [Spirochaetota bacterium]
MIFSIVIPNYNRKDDVLRALDSVYNQDHNSFEVIVVDDNSSDDSVISIKRRYPKTRIITLNKNQGPAVARNMGIRDAKGDIIICIDSDVMFQDRDGLHKIDQKFAENTQIACLAFRILKHYNKEDDIDRWWHPMPLDDYYDKEFYSDYFSGTGVAFRKEVFEKAGLFSEDLFMHNEEPDLALRILDNDFNILYYPSVIVYHNVVKNESRVERLGIREYYYHRRNQLWMVVRYYPFIKGLIFIIPRLIITFIIAAKDGKLKSYLKGIFEGFRFIPREFKRRTPLKKKTWIRIKSIKRGMYVP